MSPPSYNERFVFEHCFSDIAGKVPQLRDAVMRRDAQTVRVLARDLRNTLGLLGLPRLYQISQEIERGWNEYDHQEWNKQCHEFCDLLERIHYTIQQRLEEN